MGENLWSVEYDVVGFEGVERAFKTFLRLNRPLLHHATLDAISDEKTLPQEADAARGALVRIAEERANNESEPGKRRRRHDPQVGIELDLRDQHHFELFEAFGAYSIAADAYFDGDTEKVYRLSVHDSGTSLLLTLEDPDAFRSAAGLPPEGLVDLVTAQRRAREKRSDEVGSGRSPTTAREHTERSEYVRGRNLYRSLL